MPVTLLLARSVVGRRIVVPTMTVFAVDSTDIGVD